jgi:putative zinc finger/helix-turn-helix YgiT family protein
MKSPFTGGEGQLKKEWQTLSYRKEEFRVRYHYYVCVDTGEQFTIDEMDSLNITQVHNQYRAKYGIPFTDEIKDIRQKYGLSAAKMSEVLGLGANIYRNYESGEIPSVATGRLIRMAEDPHEFNKLVRLSKNAFEPGEFEKLEKKLHHAISGWQQVNEHVEQWLFGSKLPTELTGYKVPRLDKIGTIVSYFAQEIKPYTTALNKLLFYADFGHFKSHCTSISGMNYKAIQMGPVPANYGGIYTCLSNAGYIQVNEIDFGNFVGEQFTSPERIDIDASDLFTETEKETLKRVVAVFKKSKTKDLIKISHDEHAWRDNIDNFGRINYMYGFELKHLE